MMTYLGTVLGKAAQSIRGLFALPRGLDGSDLYDIIYENYKRAILFTIMALPVSVIEIVLFSANMSQGDEASHVWRQGIVISHSMLIVTMSVLGGLSYVQWRRKRNGALIRFLQAAIIAFVFLFGIAVTTVDQLVTTNITPFLLACAIVGVAFTVPPHFSVPAYVCAFALFAWSVGLLQKDSAVLLSNRVNGMTSVGIGVFISIVLWKARISDITQKRFIEKQKKELADKNKELEFLVFYDPLTNLLNRRRFEELVKAEMDRVKRYGQESSIILLDIDHFKQVNDRFGHPVGDQVIRGLAVMLEQNVRRTDSVSRWGGEEFMILLPCTPAAEGHAVAEKLRKLTEENPLLVNAMEIHLTASFGVVGFAASGDLTLEQVYQRADRAMYLAKDRGKNRVETLAE